MSTIRLHDVSVTYSPETVRDLEKTLGGFKLGRPAEGLPQAGPAPEPPRANALNGISLEIRDGETIGILGPSGCGKSTLLRVIAGLMPLSSGTVTYDDQDMTDIAPGERGIGIVFQNYALYPNMDSRENVGFFFRVRKRDQEIPERIREVSHVMGIGFEKLLDRRPAYLSGGERQRVAVARCIARNPKLMLFDEPLSNLDAKLRIQTRSELKRLIVRYHVTTVYVTHDQAEALALCDRLAILNEGRVEQIGTAQFLLEHPTSTMVATFLGMPPMNLFKGRVTDDLWVSEVFSLPLPNMGNRSVTIGIRAENFHLADSSGPIRGQVTLIEPLLAERVNLVHLESSGVRFVARFPEDKHVHLNEWLNLSVDASHLHLFDGISGKRF